jgi:asparagine synthase (glutamine-hydrolysing)
VASLAEQWQRMPEALRAGAASVLRHGPGRAERLAEALEADDPATRLLASSSFVHADLRGELFGGALAEHAGAAERVVRSTLRGAPGAAPLEAALYLDARLDLVDHLLTYFDRASMACSLEVRVPFLDHELVELCATIPSAQKVHRLQSKHVLREAARDLVPGFVLDKSKEGLFATKLGRWLVASDDVLVRGLLLRRNPAYAAIVDPAAVHRAVAQWRGGGTGNQKLLLALAMLELWLTEYLPRALEPSRERIAA